MGGERERERRKLKRRDDLNRIFESSCFEFYHIAVAMDRVDLIRIGLNSTGLNWIGSNWVDLIRTEGHSTELKMDWFGLDLSDQERVELDRGEMD